MILRIVSLPPLEFEVSVEIDIDKTILYGPNGVGKSNIMKTLFSIMSPDPLRILRKYFEDDYRKINVSLVDDDRRVAIRNGKIEGFHTIFNASFIENDVAYIGTNMFIRQRIDVKENLESILKDEFIWNVQDFLLDIEMPRSDIKKRKFSHGIKRALLILYAFMNSDVIFIEGFENNLHIDLLRKLFEYIDDICKSDNIYRSKIVVMETHNSFLLKLGVLKGWSVYYIDRNLIKKLDKIEDLRDLDIFRREVETIVI